MPNRSQEENLQILISALRKSADRGMSLDEAKIELFGESPHSNKATKKLLEILKTKGHVHIRMDKSEMRYFINVGH